MCQSCTPQKLTRTYSKGLVVQIVGKPPRPCPSPRSSSTTTTTTETPPCSPRYAVSPSSAEKPAENLKLQVQMQPEQVGLVESPRSREAAARNVKGPSWKMFAGGEHAQTRLADGEIGESDMDADTTTVYKSCQGQLCMDVNSGDYASKYRTCWC